MAAGSLCLETSLSYRSEGEAGLFPCSMIVYVSVVQVPPVIRQTEKAETTTGDKRCETLVPCSVLAVLQHSF